MTDIDDEINSTYFDTLPISPEGRALLDAAETFYQRDIIGYVCFNCGWWVATVMQEDEHCRHATLELPENMHPDAVDAAKIKTLRAHSRRGREET